MFNTIKEFYLLDKDELKDHLYFSGRGPFLQGGEEKVIPIW